MPPAAALEWERTGWTLLMMATDDPAPAAAIAARWPASPAPMMSTSCAGMAGESISRTARVGVWLSRVSVALCHATLRRARLRRRALRHRAQLRAALLLRAIGAGRCREPGPAEHDDGQPPCGEP